METIIVLMQVREEEAEQNKTPKRRHAFRAGEGRDESLKRIADFFFLFLSFRKEMSSILLRKK